MDGQQITATPHPDGNLPEIVFVVSVLGKLMRFERRYRRIAFESRWAIARVSFVICMVSFASGMVLMSLGSKLRWYDLFLIAFTVGLAQFGIVWSLNAVIALGRKNWLGGALLVFLSYVVWFFTYMSIRAFPLKVG